MKNSIYLFLIGAVFYSLPILAKGSMSHSNWNTLLSKYVTDNGDVNYQGFKSNEGQLDNYLNELKSNVPDNSWSKSESMAYWINAYNAFTVKLILNNYPLKSIMEINNGKAWDLKFIEIGEKKLSLNDIEHNILRKKYKDARIHFAVNCASVSCPKLFNKSFESESLESQLETLSKSFINNSNKNQINSDKVKISKLFEWYADDFSKNQTVIDFLNKYSSVKIQPKAKISYMEYDWNLNSK